MKINQWENTLTNEILDEFGYVVDEEND